MGLASKLAAAQTQGGGNAAGVGAGAGASTYPGQQQQPPQQSQYGAPPTPSYGGQQQQSSYPGQQSYGAPPGPPPSGARPTSGQYGAPPGPPPTQPGSRPSSYGAPPGAPPQYGQPPQQQGQYGQPPQQQQYGQPPQQQQYGQPPPGQYGQPPQQQQHYGAPPPQQGGGVNNGDSRFILSILTQCVQEQKIQAFYPPGSLDAIAQRVASSGALDKVATDWKMPKEIASDLAKLALFDIILYIDDSGSMAFEQQGERIDDMKLILDRVAYAASLFDSDGIQVRFMNSQVDGNGIRNSQEAAQLVQRVRFSGLTPLGTSMDRKILQPLVLGPARSNALQKPVLIITITDGAPAGEDRYAIAKVITNAVRELSRTRYGPDAISFQFAQVGDDQKALDFLAELDNHPEIGGLVDVTSNYELESAEMLRKSGIELSPDLWLVKMLMGGIDDSYDEKDESK